MANPLLNFGNTLTNITKSGVDRALNTFMNQAPNRFIDYHTGRTAPVTNLSEIAPTKSTQNVIAEGIMGNVNRKNLDFDKSFSSVIQSKGGGGEYPANRPVDYSGYKLGNPLPGTENFLKELGQVYNTMGGSAPNQIANILGDYTFRYTPELSPYHPEVMNIYDRYDFVGKAGEGRGSPYDININLPSEMIKKIKQKSLIKKQEGVFKQIKEKQLADAAAKAKADAAAKARAKGSFNPSGPTQASIRRDRADKSGRGHSGGFTNPGKGSYGPHKADGGLINFYRYGGFIG
jgi:hypothetical protein